MTEVCQFLRRHGATELAGSLEARHLPMSFNGCDSEGIQILSTSPL